MQYPVKYYLPHIVFFSVFLAVLIPFLFYYRRRNPNPRFKPTVGEMTMISVFALMIGGTACWFLGNFFRGEQNLNLDSKVPDQGAGLFHNDAPPEDSSEPRYRKE